jgi:basic amino acid/polyamine antiporter, APA family
VNNVVGSGIFAMPALVAAVLGPSAILAYVVCGVAIGLVALCFAQAGARVTNTGGVYTYVETAFGPYIGFVVSLLFWFGAQILASAAVASLMVDSIRILAPALPRSALLIAVYGFLAWINVIGVRPGSRLIEIVTVAKLAPLAILVMAALFVGHAPQVSLARAGDLGRGSLILIYAFMGIETALTPGGEVKDPARTVPRGMLIGVGLVVVFYSAVHLAAQGILGPGLAQYQTAPLAVAAEQAFHGGRRLMLLAAIVSTFGYVSGDMLATPRLLFALSRDGFLPARIGAISERHRTPVTAIITHAVVACVCAVTGTFGVLAVLAVLSLLIVYLACCLAVLVSPQFRAWGWPTVPVLASGVMLWLIFHATGREFLAVGAMVVLASIMYPLRRELSRGEAGAVVRTNMDVRDAGGGVPGGAGAPSRHGREDV